MKTEYITNLETILKEVRVEKDSILQKDETGMVFVESKSKTGGFNNSFVIRDLSKFAKYAKDVEEITEADTFISMKTKTGNIKYMKSDADLVEVPNKDETIGKLDYKEAIKITLTDEVKNKISTALETGFGESLIFYSSEGKLKIRVGGKEGQHEYSANITNCDKEFEAFVSTEFFKEALGALKGFSEMYINPQPNYPIKITDSIEDDYETTLYIAPRSEA
jgi:hypothetical protein